MHSSVENVKTLKEKTIQSGRLYPRPLDTCDACKTSIVLCWGETHSTPYWRHVVKTDNHTIPNGESALHKQAKVLLCDYLLKLPNNKRTDITFQHHKYLDLKTCLPNNYKNVKTEVKLGASVLDIALFDTNTKNNDNTETEKVIFGIEIWNTHKTSKLSDRNLISWVEIKAEDVITFFDNPKNDSKNSKMVFTDYSINIDKELELECESERECEHELIKKTHLQLAEELGYLSISKEQDGSIAQLMDFATFGFTQENVSWDTTCCDDDDIHNKFLWKEVLANKECLFCGNSYNGLAIRKPFHKKCWSDIKNERYETDIKYYDLQKTQELREKLKWLDQIPGGSEIHTPCMICKRKPFRDFTDDKNSKYFRGNSNFVPNFTSWKFQKRQICYFCLGEFLKNPKVLESWNLKELTKNTSKQDMVPGIVHAKLLK